MEEILLTWLLAWIQTSGTVCMNFNHPRVLDASSLDDGLAVPYVMACITTVMRGLKSIPTDIVPRVSVLPVSHRTKTDRQPLPSTPLIITRGNPHGLGTNTQLQTERPSGEMDCCHWNVILLSNQTMINHNFKKNY